LNYYEKYQGVLHIIRSAAIACKHHSITLSIVGNGDYLPKLIKEVEKYTQDNLEIIATGYTDNVSNYYNSADIFAYHSTLDSWPNVLMEAMAHGMPIIANNHQQFSEVFCKKQQAILCESGNESCLTKTLLNLIENQKTYNHSAQLSTSRAIELSSNKRNISIFKNWLREIYIKE